MKLKLLLVFCVASGITYAQRSSLFATTGSQAGAIDWGIVRKVNWSGTEDKLILNGNAFAGTAVNASNPESMTKVVPGTGDARNQPAFTGIAGLAYDQEHSRLFFATMFTGELRYIDLSKKGAGKYYQAGNIFEQVSMRGDRTPADHQNQGPVITRMTIGSDGYGYGLSNDAQTFFRFTTGKDVQVQELGPLVDDDANGSLSVHNRCSGGWGGDMVAGADGKLYLITNTLSVFSIEPETRLATHIGRIKGLPGDFIVNGAAVNDDGQVVLSNATIAGKFGLVTDFGNLQGKLIEQAEWLNASDLASANLLFQSQSTAKTIDPLPERKTTDDGIGIFPNPVTNGRVLISFDKVGPGDYTIDLVTGTGNIAMRKPVRITTKGQQVEMNVNAMAKGFYSVRVVNGQKRDVASAKLVIQ